jgi:hypothetical protein
MRLPFHATPDLSATVSAKPIYTNHNRPLDGAAKQTLDFMRRDSTL